MTDEKLTEAEIDRVAKRAGKIAGGCAEPVFACGCLLVVVFGGVAVLALCVKLFLAIL